LRKFDDQPDRTKAGKVIGFYFIENGQKMMLKK